MSTVDIGGSVYLCYSSYWHIVGSQWSFSELEKGVDFKAEKKTEVFR